MMEDHGRDLGIGRPVVADTTKRSAEEWVFSSVEEAAKQADRRHRDYVEEHPQTQESLRRRVDSKAIGDLYGEATAALAEGRDGAVGPDRSLYGDLPTDPELEEAYMQEALDTASDLGLLTVIEYGVHPPTRFPVDSTGAMWEEAESTTLCPSVVSTPKPRRPVWNEYVPETMVQDLPDISTVEQVSQPRCKCPHPERHDQALAQVQALKQREGDQPLPEINDEPYIQNLVVEDIKQRLNVGISRYGTGLQAFNGRNAARDAYEEALDLTCYLKQVSIEVEQLQERLEATLRENDVLADHVEALQRIIGRVEQVAYRETHTSARDTINRVQGALRAPE